MTRVRPPSRHRPFPARRAIPVLILSVVALFLLSSVTLPRLGEFAHAAQTQAPPDRSLSQDRRIGTQRVRAGSNTRPSLDQLADIARDEGRVRIIVGLRVAFQPEGRMNAAAVSAQRLRIAQTRAALLSRLAPSSVTGLKEFDFIPFVALAVDAAGFERLRDAPERTSIEEDSMLAPSLEESVPLIGAPSAWASGYSGAGQTVAILDSGVDKNHPFLTGKVVSEACYSTTSAQTTTVCPGGVSQSTTSGSGVPCGVGGCNHGTHVAGIAAGQSVPFSGVARDANVIAIQVFSRINGCSGSNCITAFTSDILLGMQRVQVLNGTFSIAAVNLSLGGGTFGSNCDSLETAFKAGTDSLRGMGIASVIASGNDASNGGMSSPGCISTAVSVGSTADGSGGSVVDTISSFSNSASFLNLLAPGHWINSSVPGGGFSVFSGTSMATPHVAGAWAVLKSKTPAASVGQVLQALTNTGLPITDPRNGVVKSRIRVDQAVNALPAGACSYAISSTSQAFPLGGGSTTVDVTADSGCSWTASSNVSWINVLSGNSGTGNGNVSFSVASNPLLERAGTLFIAGQTFIVSQPSTPVFGVDDGTFENATGLGAGGSSYRVNRLTPAAYPATINSIGVFFPGDSGVHFGNAFSVIAGTNPGGGSNINGIQFAVNSPVTVQVTDQFNIYSIPALTINSGDFVVGIFMNHAAGVFPFSLDQSPPHNQRSYRSLNGTTFTLTDDLGLPGNYSFRAIPTQSISCPVITNVNPPTAAAGTNVTIMGTGFTGVTGVKFTNNVTASFNVINDTTITATVPVGATTGPITVSKTGCADVQTAPFTVIACPTVSGINPTSGIVGSSVVITGSNFTGVSAVTFSNGASATFNVNSATQITATVPAGAVSGPITISKPGCSDVQTPSFTVIACPTVNGINPSSGLVGSSVVMTGSNFTGVTAVKFSNNVSASFSVDNPTQITATVPGGAVSGPITISRPPCADIQTTTFTVITCPTVNGINPTSGIVGSSVVITGNNFTGVTAVKFSNNVSAAFTVNGPTQITATVPVGAVTGPMTIVRLPCTDIQTSSFTVITCPTVSGINPTTGTFGNSVVITGTDFTGVSAVKFSNNVNASFTVDGPTQITAAVPAGAISGPITISRPSCSDIQTASFTVFTCPTVNGINPTTGIVGNSVVITGNNFIGVTAVKFSNNVSASFNVDSSTQITATVPAGAVSGVITISRPGCSDIQTSSFTVVTCPTVSVIDPMFGLVGSSVIITGNNFNGVNAVKFSNNINATFTVNNSTQITATVPAGAVTGVITISRPLCNDVQTANFEVRNPESDVAPRPSGSGAVVVSDWVQVGRFSVNLDTPAPGSEFQRADCAPRATLGDGQISVADWVQAGRYSVALDPPVAAGGPTSPPMPAQPVLNWSTAVNGANEAQVRRVRVVDTVLRRGQIGSVLIEFDALGNENALSFTLGYDGGKAVFVDAVGEGRASTSSLLVNARQAAAGRVALALALPTGMTFAAGTQTLLTLRFLPAGGDGQANMQVRFDDSLINREIVTWDARRVTVAAYDNASLTIDGNALAVVSAASFASGAIAPESIAAAFGIGLAVVTETAATLPLPTELGGTTVTVLDSAGVEHEAPLFFVSESQVNFQIPKECAVGIASVTVRSGTRVVAAGLIDVVEVAPALFTAGGVAAGNVFRIRSDGQGEYEALLEYDAASGTMMPVPIDLGEVGEEVYVVLYGTGFRGRRGIGAVTAKIGGIDAPVAYGAAHESLIGVDQIKLLVPRELAARGEVRIEIEVDGIAANDVFVRVR